MVDVLRALMIENRPGDADKVCELLSQAELDGRLPAFHVQLEHAVGLDAGLACLESAVVDAVLLCLSSPDDLHQLPALRQQYAHLPVIVCVNSGNESLAMLAMSQGASDYLYRSTMDARRVASVFRHALVAQRFYACEQRLRWVEDHISEVVWRTGADLRISEITGSITRLAGFTVEEALHSTLFDWIVPDSRQTLQDVLQFLQSMEPAALPGWNASIELEHLRKGGSPFWAEIRLQAALDAQGQLAGLVGVTRDVSSRHAIQEKLDYLSMHDPLTGLYNRAYFLVELKRLEFSRLYPITILMADLEGLKAVNYQHGILAGDDLIKRAAALLRSTFRAEDMVARIGGDEFIVLMPHCSPRSASRALQRVVNLINAHNEETQDLPVNLSLGIATAEQGQSLMETVKTANSKKITPQATD